MKIDNKSKTPTKSENKQIPNDVKDYLIKDVKYTKWPILLGIAVIIFANKFNNYTLCILLIMNIICLVTKTRYRKRELNFSLLVIYLCDYYAIFRIQLSKPLLSSFYICLIILFFLVILIDTIVICITFYIEEIKTPKVVEKLPPLLKIFHKAPAWVHKIGYALKMLFPIVAYFALTILIIFTFSTFYLYISCLLDDESKRLVKCLSDSLYYSATTYFTVGFGDILPKTTQFKFISVIEMIISNFLNIIFIPMIVTFFLGFLNKDKNNELKD